MSSTVHCLRKLPGSHHLPGCKSHNGESTQVAATNISCLQCTHALWLLQRQLLLMSTRKLAAVLVLQVIYNRNGVKVTATPVSHYNTSGPVAYRLDWQGLVLHLLR